MSKVNLPNLVIAGVVKGGTTSIFSYLSLHPDVCCSSVKETCYYLAFRYGKKVEPFEKYQQYFSHCQGQKYIMEATPGYFEGGERVAKEIKKQLGDQVKILIVLRNPIDRLMSFLKFKKSMLELDKNISLREYVQACEYFPYEERVRQENDTYWGVDGGFYANYLEDWFDVFGDSIKIIFFDQLKNNRRLLLKDLCNWLDLDDSIFDYTKLAVENKSINYKNQFFQRLALFINIKSEKFLRANPKLKSVLRQAYYTVNGAPHQEKTDAEMLSYLQSVYRPYNQRLFEQLISRGYTNLPEWLENSKI